MKNVGLIALPQRQWTLQFDSQTGIYYAVSSEGVKFELDPTPMGSGKTDFICQLIARGVFS